MKWNVPNILTVFRLVAAPGVLLVYLILPRPLADWTALALFIGASATDWIDGHIARSWNQGTKLGTMLDPIADKAMVIIALATLIGLLGLNATIALPAAIIFFREVFVSGLREYLGDTAGTLKVTKLAKWKTTIQMVAIAVLLCFGGFYGTMQGHALVMDADTFTAALSGAGPDPLGLRWLHFSATATLWAGTLTLWIAAGLTIATGWDYFTKALPYLKD